MIFRICLALALVALVAILPPSHLPPELAGVLMMGTLFPVKPLFKSDLLALVNPEQANQPEAIAWELFDTQTLLSQATSQLTFFQRVDGSNTLSNMESQGQLPDPQFFQIYYIYLDILQQPTTGAALAGAAIQNIDAIVKSASNWNLFIAGKSYGFFPLTDIHARGGAVGVLDAGTVAAVVSAANNGDPNSTWCHDGRVVLPPKQNFGVRLTWATPPDFGDEAQVDIRIIMSGVLFRRVL